MSDSKCELCPNNSEYEYQDKLLCSECVSTLARRIEGEHIPEKKERRNRGKSISEIETKKDFSGEGSPYWEHLAAQGWQNEKGQLMEPGEGNPDVFSEDANPYKRDLTEEGELQLDVVRDVMEKLTPLQREVLAFCERPDCTEESAALHFNMTRRALRTILSRVKSEIQRRYEQRQKSMKWQK